MSDHPLIVVGIGADGPAGLTVAALNLIRTAEVLAGGRRHLDLFADIPAEHIVIDADRDRWLAQLRDVYRRRQTVVLASGDPLFYGVGRLLLEALPREHLRFVPHVSAVQLAFARIPETWDDARVVSVHGRALECLVPALDERTAKIAILTDANNDPAAIARLLRERGLASEYRIWIGENLGGEDERVVSLTAEEVEKQTFAPLNIVILIREPKRGPAEPRGRLLLGIPDAALDHRGDLITKREVRLISLCHLELREGEVFWDIGAGSGSVAIEAARLVPALEVYAIERSPQAALQIAENCKQFGLTRVRVVRGEAPEALAALPDPDTVFIGGSGGRLTDILVAVGQRLRAGGRVVLNCITLENLSGAWEWLRGNGWNPEATSVQLSHSRAIGTLSCLEPERAITIVRARKPQSDEPDAPARNSPR